MAAAIMHDTLHNTLFGNWTPFVMFSALKVVMAIGVLLPMVAYSVMVERRVSAAIQDRVGPNRVGPFGLLQPLADGLKSILKEDFTPSHVRKAYFILAPAVTMIPAFLSIAVIPFGSKLGNQSMVIADLNVGILYTFSVVSLGVYGIMLCRLRIQFKIPFLWWHSGKRSNDFIRNRNGNGCRSGLYVGWRS